MTKQELVEFMAEKAGLTKADATRALDAFVEGVTTGIVNKGKVSLVGFLTFEKKEREEEKRGKKRREKEEKKERGKGEEKGKKEG